MDYNDYNEYNNHHSADKGAGERADIITYGAGGSTDIDNYGTGSTTDVNTYGGGFGTTDYIDYGLEDYPYRRTVRRSKIKKSAKYITRRAFAVCMILCMLATSALTIGGLALSGALGKGETRIISATNYTLSDATASMKSVEEIVAMNENAVVEIQTETMTTASWLHSYITKGAGSGVIIDESGYILTCNHVIENATNITVTTKDGSQYKATVVGASSATDTAVIRIGGAGGSGSSGSGGSGGFTAASYGNSDELSVGQLAVAIGNPLGQLGGSASTGIISALNRTITVEGKTLTLLQTDAPINPGNSGGGLFDGYGNLIGIVVAKSMSSDSEGLGFAIPINKAAALASKIIKEGGDVTGGSSGRALIGITVIEITTEEQKETYNVDSLGVYIYEVTSTNAQKAGFMVQDRIVSAEGTEIHVNEDLSAILSTHKPGDTINVIVERDGELLELTTKLISSDN